MQDKVVFELSSVDERAGSYGGHYFVDQSVRLESADMEITGWHADHDELGQLYNDDGEPCGHNILRLRVSLFATMHVRQQGTPITDRVHIRLTLDDARRFGEALLESVANADFGSEPPISTAPTKEGE